MRLIAMAQVRQGFVLCLTLTAHTCAGGGHVDEDALTIMVWSGVVTGTYMAFIITKRIFDSL